MSETTTRAKRTATSQTKTQTKTKTKEKPTNPGGKRERIKYLDVAEDIRAQITSGQLQSGDLLPSEPELVARYNVSRNTARNAIATLRAQGLITVIHGRGAFVRRTSDRPAHTYHHHHAHPERNQRKQQRQQQPGKRSR